MTDDKKNPIGADSPGSEDELYRQLILDHYRYPRNVGRLETATLQRRELNPVCGDEIELFVRLNDDERVTETAWVGHGCAISQAAVSLLTDRIKGMAVSELACMTSDDAVKLLGAAIGPSRMNCALLGLKTLKRALDEYDKYDKNA